MPCPDHDEHGVLAFGYLPSLDTFSIVLFDLDSRPIACMNIARSAIETALAIRATPDSKLVPHAPATFHLHTLKELICNGDT